MLSLQVWQLGSWWSQLMGLGSTGEKQICKRHRSGHADLRASEKSREDQLQVWKLGERQQLEKATCRWWER